MSDDLLTSLAAARGVLTTYWNYSGHECQVSSQTLRAVLAAVGSNCDDDTALSDSLRENEDSQWRRVLPLCSVNQEDHNTWIPVHVPHGAEVSCYLELEDGSTVELAQVDHWVEPRVVDGNEIGCATFDIPAGLPLGWHTIVAVVDDTQVYRAPFANTPAQLQLPSLRDGRGWGVMAQLYSVRSAGSWGIGDAVDLGELARWAATQGADFVLINPVHAGEPVPPLTPSPYLPSSRQFINPLYIRPEAITEYSQLADDDKNRIKNLRQQANQDEHELLDRDRSWQAKLAALELIFAQPRSQARIEQFANWRREQGENLERFAAWCALTEKYGYPLPEELTDVDSEVVAAACAKLAQRCEFFVWLQWVVDEQFTRAQQVACEAGMRIGIMHDLAVGVHKHGGDIWLNRDLFAQNIEVGAPADMYNQLGQNWSQPPWRPDELEARAYEPLRQMVRQLASKGGALRLDHIMGLFRLWWIPAHAKTPAEGAYMRYRFDHMVGVMALEAHRAGCVIVGEDLGTVEPWVREYLADRGILGTAVAWFEYEGDNPRPPQNYRHLQLAAVNTHDLPPCAGYLQDEHVRLRAELGILENSEADEYARAKAERERMLKALRHQGVLAETQTDISQITEALYRYVAATPSALVAVSLTDITGEKRAQNQPGTDREYPNWCIPLGDAKGEPVTIEDLNSGRFNHLPQVVETQIHH